VTDAAIANAPEEKPPKILPETHFAAGLLFERQGQFERAILQYRKAVALNANYVVAFHRLGRLQSATGQHVEAVKALQRAVALRPDNADLHNDLGFECMHTQQWEDAEHELRRAIELQPDLATGHINLGLVYAKSERFAESLASFQAVLPEADAYYNLGLMYQGQQRYSEARETFQHVLTIAPGFSAAKFQLERLAAGAEPATPVEGVQTVEAVVETPQLENVPDQVPVVTGDTLPPITGSEVVEERPVVENEPKVEAESAEPAGLPAIIDSQTNLTAPTESPASDSASLAGSSDDEEGIVEAPGAEFIDESPENSVRPGVGQVAAAETSEEDSIMPGVVIATEDAVAVFDEFEYDEPVAAEFAEEAPAVAVTVESAEPPLPCDVESEEADVDDRIAALPPVPITQPIRARNSWTMIKELEDKVAMLRSESQASKKKLVSVTWP